MGGGGAAVGSGEAPLCSMGLLALPPPDEATWRCMGDAALGIDSSLLSAALLWLS